eukprot:TRINITY_DN25272_c0_g1_i1.p1 TRINITY_DN25272_c0_g1~~TRINITY_DN25272_c0_g1_i1.p1  ORF type:complete len:152 (-),score=32.52 TRINITY_DN25272_c0_g1_i1:10-408(-)
MTSVPNSKAAVGNKSERGGKGDDDNEDSERDSEADDSGYDEPGQGRKFTAEGKKNKIEVSEWLDDIMEGFAELYRLAVNGGQSCGDTIRKAAYPVKEGVLSAYDGVRNAVNPSTETQANNGNFNVAPTIRHE